MKWKHKYLWSIFLIPIITITPLVITACANVNNVSPEKPNISPEKPNIGTLDELRKSGQHNNIHYNKYFVVLSALNLQQNTRLNILNNDYIKATVIQANQDFKDINISIISGDQSRSELILGISGSYKNISIPFEEVVITGFYSKLEDYNIVDQMTIIDLNFNDERYFNKLQTKFLELLWSASDFFYYSEFVSAWRQGHPEPTRADLTQLFNDKIIHAELINFSEIVNNTNNFNAAKINVKFVNYLYINGVWKTDVNTQSKTISFTKVGDKLPDLKRALKFAIDNKLIISNNANDSYASAVYSQLIQDEEGYVANNFVHVEETFYNTYFSDNSNNDNYLLIQGDSNSTVNDIEGKLELLVNFSLPIFGGLQYSKVFNIENFLKTIDYFNANNTANANLIHISTKGSTMWNRIVNSIKAEFDQAYLQNLPQNETVTMTSNPVYFRPQNLEYQLYNSEKLVDKLDTNLLSNGSFSFLGSNFTQASINSSTNLYRTRDRTSFWIQNLIIAFDETIKPTITKVNATYLYKLDLKYHIYVLGGTYTIETFYVCPLLDSDLGFN